MIYTYALVTGATSGIGEAFAYKLSSEGVRLLLTGRNKKKLQALEKKLGCQTVVADLSTEKGIATLIGAARSVPIDLLVHSAGIGVTGSFLSLKEKTHQETVLTHVMAPVQITYELAKDMANRTQKDLGRRGGIIFVTSTAAFQPLPYFSVYGAAKAFMLSFAEALQQELKKVGIDVLALCPGEVNTPFWKGYPLQKRWLSPEQVVDKAFSALGKKTFSVVGLVNYLRAFSTRFFPRRFVLPVSEKIVRRLMNKRKT